jgi:hypothetical protein
MCGGEINAEVDMGVESTDGGQVLPSNGRQGEGFK